MESSTNNNKKTQLLYKLFLRGYKSPILSVGLGQRSRSNSCLLGADFKCNNGESAETATEQRYKRRQRTPDNEIAPPPPPFLSLSPLALDLDRPDEPPADPNMAIIVDELEKECPERKEDDDPPSRSESKLSNLAWACETLDKRKDLIQDFFQRSILKQRQEQERRRKQQQEEQDLPHLQDSSTYCVLNSNHHRHGTLCRPLSLSLSPEPIYAEISSESEIQRGISFMSDTDNDSGFNTISGRDQAEMEEYDSVMVQESSIEKSVDPVYENLDVIRHEIELKRQNPDIYFERIQDYLDVAETTRPALSLPSHPQTTALAEKSGEIDEESIIENKPAIKRYWETKMSETAASQFARSNFGVTSPTITDKINEEIREDYMRNLELMHDEGLPRSSDSDTSDEPIEFDSFDMASSSNGSSPFGQPNDASSPLMMPESPSLIDSGHQSQESHLSPENDHLTYDGNVGQNRVSNGAGYNGFNGSIKLGPQSPSDQPPQGKKSLGNVRVGPIVNGYRNATANANDTNRPAPTGQGQGKIENHVTHYITFNKPFTRNVKSVEEPVRNQEREKSPLKSHQPPKEVKEATEDSVPASLKTSQESLVKPVKADISYMLAASRLKKEIEDNLKRERELKDEGRVRTLSVDTVLSSPVPSPADPSLSIVEVTSPAQSQPRRSESEEPEAVVPRSVSAFKTLESPPREIKNEAQAQVKKFEAIAAAQKNLEQQQQLQPKSSLAKRDSHPPAKQPQQELHVQIQNQNQSTPNQQPQPQVGQPQQLPRHQPLPSFKIGKNFNSMERYIMYSSLTKLNLRSMPPTPTNTVFSPSADVNFSMNGFEVDVSETTIVEPDSTVIESSSARPEKEKVFEVVPEPAEKIRRNYIPTEKKIKDELLEMVQREEELKKTREQWKSTPNLSNLNLGEDEDEMEEVQHRQVPTRRVAEKRRRSALISKWEEMISKYNQ